MTIRHHFLKLLGLTLVATMPILGLSAAASAKSATSAKGSAAWCAAHPKQQTRAICATASAGTGGPTGQSTDPIVVTVSPNPLVETGQSEIHAVIQVETSPAFAGDIVDISSSQLLASCMGNPIYLNYESLQGASTSGPDRTSNGSIQVVLDDDGNATATIESFYDCAPGTDVISADLESAPYYTALTTLTALPPVVTATGLTGTPNDEVETGDTGASGNSDVYAVFNIETSPVYAEMPVTISSPQLEARCGQGWRYEPGNGGAPNSFADGFTGDVNGTGVNTGPKFPTTLLDDDGNATIVFEGASCAAGDSVVTADVEAGTHPTYTTVYTIDPPAPTI
jgi:hypothetical protein